MPETNESQHSENAATTAHTLPINGILPPEKLNIKGNIAENWKAFKQMWSNYAVITNIGSQSQQYQVALFLHCIGPEALKIYNGMSFEGAEDREKLDCIIQKFDQFTIGEVNETYERYVFNSRNQAPNESTDAYVATLRTLAQTCNFCECMRDSLIRDRIVLGVGNAQTRKKLLQQRKLTLNKCIDTCRSVETAATQMKAISGTAEDVHKVNMKQHQKPRIPNRKPRTAKDDRVKKTCNFCGGNHPQQKERCPAWGQKCHKCGGRNHFASKCRKPQSQIHGISHQEHDHPDSEVDYITSVGINTETVGTIEQSGYQREIYIEMLIDGTAVKFQVDCGASINILPERFLKSHDVFPTTKPLMMWNKTEVKPLGTTRMVIQNPKNKKKFSVEFVIVRDDLTPLIGARAAQHMKLITVHQENFTPVAAPKRGGPDVNQLLTMEKVVKEYPDVFERNLGTFPGKVHLEVDPDIRPVITSPRRIPTALKEKFKEELQRLEDLKVIAPVDKPTPWVSSVVVATKKSGALRVCIDPRPLNIALKRERYQLPVLDDILPELSKAKIFSTVDLRSGYWHCVLDEESSLMTTFATPYGRYRWCRLPFGLSVSSEIFQKRVNQILEGLEGILDITDDILIYVVG